KKLSIARIQGRHHDILTRAISNVLSSPVAEITYGQIIDGLPLSSVVLDTHLEPVCPEHPLLDEHLELSTDVLERVKQLRASLDPDILQIDSTVSKNTSLIIHPFQAAYAYQAATPGSRAFKTRLIELVARAVHQIAVWLFKQEPMRYKDDCLMSWRPDKDALEWSYRRGFPPTFFRHPWYIDYDQYPEGVADGVGYWAEARILGGVVLFDRRGPDSSPDVELDAVYFHSDNREVTYRIYRLLDEQKQQLIQFLLSEITPPSSCPLPIHGDMDNHKRIDPEEPIKDTGIYRDKRERRPPDEDEGDMRLRDVVDDFNYVSRQEFSEAHYRATVMRKRRWRGEHLGW
ncbi:hypothetical protein QBC46DRAFT_426217, partial [Diplogelasinospora grovesii]